MNWLNIKKAKIYLKKKTDLDISVDTIRSWIIKGLISSSGFRIVLRARKRRGWWFTTTDWIDEFIEETGA